MKGSINTRQHCEKCGEKFLQEHVDGEGLHCPTCLTRPTRYFINARAFGLTYIYTDRKTGKVFKTYSDALDTLIELNRDFKKAGEDKKKFSTEDWIPEKIAEKRIENIFSDRLTFYEAELENGAISKTRVANIKKCQKHILDYFRGWDIRDIKEENLNKFYLSLLRKKLSSRYIKDILDTLKMLFTFLSAAVDMPKFPKFTVVDKKEKQMLGLAREIAVMDKVPERRGYRLGILILIRTGMRIDELPALKVVDCVDGILNVNKAYTEGKIRNTRKAGGKVEYQLSPELWDMLMEHIKDKEPDNFIFDIDGRNIPSGRWYKIWKIACIDAKVKPITLQQASRHSTASRIWNRKKKEAYVEIAETLGHNNLTTAKKHYIIEGREN